MKLTINKLKELLQAEINFHKLELMVTSIRRTRFRKYDYEAGACYYYVWTCEKYDEKQTNLYLIFYPLKEMEKMLNLGYKFIIVGDEFKLLKQD